MTTPVTLLSCRISNFHCIDKLSDMFHESHVKQHPGKSVCEVFFMDVVLDRAIISRCKREK
jgi:hypothetical protein